MWVQNIRSVGTKFKICYYKVAKFVVQSLKLISVGFEVQSL
jgi:hypothetical protein